MLVSGWLGRGYVSVAFLLKQQMGSAKLSFIILFVLHLMAVGRCNIKNFLKSSNSPQSTAITYLKKYLFITKTKVNKLLHDQTALFI